MCLERNVVFVDNDFVVVACFERVSRLLVAVHNHGSTLCRIVVGSLG